ncbi:TPA: hypothetical protein ACV20N_002384 [Acinetobacter baumannii]
MNNVIVIFPRRNGLSHKVSLQDVKQRLINLTSDVELKKVDQIIGIDFESLPHDELIKLARSGATELLNSEVRHSLTKQRIELVSSFLQRRSKEEWKKYNDSMTFDLEAAAKARAFEEANDILPEVAESQPIKSFEPIEDYPIYSVIGLDLELNEPHLILGDDYLMVSECFHTNSAKEAHEKLQQFKDAFPKAMITNNAIISIEYLGFRKKQINSKLGINNEG